MNINIEEIVREYWDTEYFTIKELSEQGVCICERDFGDENRVGIMVKQEENVYHVVVRIFSDCLSKTYDSFPTVDILIKDFTELWTKN